MISRKIAKRIKVVGLASMIMFTGMASSVMADVKVEKKNESKVEYKIDENSDLETCVIKWEKLTLDNLLGDMIKDVSKEDQAKLENLIEKINKLEEAEKYEEAEKVWSEADNILNKYYDKMVEEYKPQSFKEFMKGWGQDIKKDDLAKMEKFYNAAIKLEEEKKYEEAEKQWEEFYSIMDQYNVFEEELGEYTTGMIFEEMKLDDFLGDIKKELTKEEYVKLEKLFENVMKLEKSDKYEEATKVWDEIYSIMDKYFENIYGNDEYTTCNLVDIEDMKFEDYMSDLKEDIKKEDLTKMEELYNAATKLDKEAKYEEASKKWDEFYKIMDGYFKVGEGNMMFTEEEAQK